MREGFNPLTQKYYDVNGVELNHGDWCVRISKEKSSVFAGVHLLSVGRVIGFTSKYCIFDSGRSEYGRILSLKQLGFDVNPDVQYGHIKSGCIDYFGNSVAPGDLLLIASEESRIPFFALETATNSMCAPDDYSAFISLTALSIVSFEVHPPAKEMTNLGKTYCSLPE